MSAETLERPHPAPSPASSWHPVLKVVCVCVCAAQTPLVATDVHAFTFLTSREAAVLRARLIRASNASEPHRRCEVIGVPGPCLTRAAAGPVKTGERPRR